MQENNRRLIDEALLDEPIKNTFRLAWEFIILNRNFTLISMGIFLILNLFGAIPILSLVFSVLATVFGIVIQMYVGKTFYATENIETYVEDIQKSRIDEVWKSNVKAAFGVYIGWILLMFLLVFILVVIGISTGIFTQNMNEQDVFMALTGLGIPFLLLLLFFSYVQPLVQSNIVLTNTFEEGFKAVFTLFSKDVWSSALQKSYFTYVAKVGLVLMIFMFIVALIIGFLSMIPFVGIIFMLMMLIAIYILMVVMSIISMMARRIVEE